MRTLPQRPTLPFSLQRKLQEKALQINKSADPKNEASRLYALARPRKWFRPVVDTLRQMAGPGERCMFCSGSESAEIEHFKPKSTFPNSAMEWGNYVWACGICNRCKANRFPTSMPTLIHPIDENAWEFFFIDEFGNLVPKWRPDLNGLDPRAVVTRDLLSLDRQALQESRKHRRAELVRFVEDSLARFQSGQLSRENMRQRKVDLLSSPAQPDVADYFLNGPGRKEKPFDSFVAIVDAKK